MNSPALTRRRAITIMAAVCASAFTTAPSAIPHQEWRGTALGAEGHLIFQGLDNREADRLIALVIAEIDRLEQIFSLYRPDSQISRLNRETRLEHASHDLQVVLAASLDMWRRSDGAFNPAIQPLWQMLNKHFSGSPDNAGPDQRQISAALEFCNPDHIRLVGNTIALRPGMALTLNGIAQGHITDRVVALLRQNGLTDTLVQLGETRALPGRSWQVEIAGTARLINLQNSAIATSAGAGTELSRDGRWHHLIDPRTGRSCHEFTSLSVCASSALIADALSTTLAVVGRQDSMRIARRFPDVTVLAVHANGGFMEFGT